MRRACGWAMLLGVALVANAGAQERPNILFIIADDHGAYVSGAYGNEQVRTPNIDALASEGMRFDRAYCNAPVCTASRQSFLTGRYPRSVGVTQLRTALPEAEITLAEALGAQGYDTAAIGKMHFNSNLTHGFDVRADRPQHAALLKERGAKLLPEGIDTLGPWRPFKSPAREWLNSMVWPYPAVEADMPSHFFVDEAEQFITAERDNPFFCIVSFYEPHSPFHFPVEFRDRVDRATLNPPNPGPEDAWQIPIIFEDLTREEKQGITASYYTSVEYMDSNVGKVLTALDASGKAENTIVVYFSDHGYFLGHHGRIEKHAMYEEAIHVPLIVRYPEIVAPGTSTDALVELIDLFPTVTDLCRFGAPDAVQGRSLRPVLDGSHSHHRDHVFVEYSENEEAMVRDERWKLIYGSGQRHRQDGYETRNPTPGRTILLYDTVNDPNEHHNLADDPAQAERVDRMLTLLADHLTATARESVSFPVDAPVFDVLDWCVKPNDIN